MTTTKKTTPPDALRDKHRTTVTAALQNTQSGSTAIRQKTAAASQAQSVPPPTTPQPIVPAIKPNTQPAPQTPPQSTHKQPFLIGLVKNHKNIPLPNILIYIKDGHDTTLRILKSNPHGVFATYNALPAHSYQFTFTDPKGEHIFDTIKLDIKNSGNRPLEVYSKELL